jgi:hypothetical protein
MAQRHMLSLHAGGFKTQNANVVLVLFRDLLDHIPKDARCSRSGQELVIIMVSSQLPPKPDFEALAASAPASADRRTVILALIGNLVSSWSNNESLFIYVLMILLKTDQASAALTFATLNTTRARLDLIQRLAKITIKDKNLDKTLAKIIERFNESTHVRNEFNHCMYITDASGQITHTQSMRIVQTKNSLQFGEMKSMDEARLKSMVKTTKEMTRINRDIWDFLPKLESHLRSKGGSSS